MTTVRPPQPSVTASAPGAWQQRALDALPSAAIYLRGDRIEWANAAAHELLGVPSGALAGKDVFALVHPADLHRVRSRYFARQRGEVPPERYELDAIRPDGQHLRVEIEPRVFGPGETIFLLRGLDTHEAERKLLNALGELGAALQRERTEEGVIRAAATGLRALGFHVALLRAEEEHLAIKAVQVGTELRELLETTTGVRLDTLVLPRTSTPNTDRIIARGRAEYFDDVAPLFDSMMRALGQKPSPGFYAQLRSCRVSKLVVAPIRVGEAAWGVLGVAADQVRSNDAAAISLFATQFASALEAATTIEQLKEQNQTLEAIHRVAMLGAQERIAQLVPRMLQIVTGATASHAACMYLLDEDVQELALAGTWNYDGPMAKKYARIPLRATATGSAASSMVPRAMSLEQWPEQSRPDVAEAGFLESAIVPLVVDGRLGGTLNLSRTQRRPYTETELRSAQMLAAQVALQVERARLYEEAQRRVEELSLMNELGALLNQNLDLQHVLHTATRDVSRIVGVPRTFLLLLGPSGKTLDFVASNEADPTSPTLSLPLDSPSAAAEAVRQRRPVIIEDAVNDPRTNKALASHYGHKALLVAPLISEGKAVGALVLGETRGPRRFSKEVVDRVVNVANQLASAVENARLYAEQRRRVEQLKVLLDISRLITGSLELQQILEASAQNLVRMIDATDAFIWLLDDTVLKGVVASSPEHKEHFAQVRIPLSEPSAEGAAVLMHAPVRYEDAEASMEVNQSLNARYRQKSLLAIPLMLRDVPIGAISIGDRRKKRAFTDDEVERALLISRQLAVAIDNARLFDDLKRSYHELARAQKELVRRERLAALGELSAVVAHEVRNPLGVIFNSLSSLKRMVPQNEDARMLLGIVGEEADRLNRMVGDLLDFARPTEAQLRPEPLHEVVQGAVEAASRAMPAGAVKVVTEIADDLPAVPVDAQMVRQAVVNLVVNAMQAMPRGGTIIVRTLPESRGDARFVRVDVQDDGPGIPTDVADRVFQPFFTTRAAGTGLGLAVVKRIADAHRADLSVRSTPGKGSTFTLLLPVPT